MKIKGIKIRDKTPIMKGQLYVTDEARTICFEEEKTSDIVNIHFHMEAGQYGVYGNEYIPPFIEKEGVKKADILTLVIDDNQKHFSSWILDVKKAVGGEDVILHLVEQLAESIKHKNTITNYMEDYTERQHVGYVTRELQGERIQEAVCKKKAYIENEKMALERVPILIGTGMKTKLLKEEAKLKVLTAFQNNYIELRGEKHIIENYLSHEEGDKYVCDLDVVCF
ncbi:MAG: hypothetical protein LUC98_01145 [Lachnospiraceae bacterium]|nr:hypothetical protein [Lachnospiraceae bacterium]